MNCESVRKNAALFLYGELSLEQEQEFQDHLDECGACRTALDKEKEVHNALDAREVEPPAALLVRCRRDLELRLAAAGPQHAGWRRWFTLPAFPAFARPAGALALVALGFFAARWTSADGSSGPPALTQVAGTAEPVVSRIRYLQPQPSGEIRLVVEETRQRLFTGDPDDERIRGLLLAAARDASDPGLRADSLQLLRPRSGSTELRDLLVDRLRHDANPGVRLKALDALQAFAAEAEVRDALAQVLLTDDNPGLRAQAIDLLVQHKQDSMVGLFQELVQRDSSNYVRLRSRRALEDLNASVGTF
jgi:hypothetical protein